MKKIQAALAVFALFFTIQFVRVVFSQTLPHKVLLTWDVYPNSRASNPGMYNVYRSIRLGDFCVGTPAYFSSVKQAYAANSSGALVSVPPSLIDTSVTATATYCYYVSFAQTPSGSATQTESELSDAVTATIPQ